MGLMDRRDARAERIQQRNYMVPPWRSNLRIGDLVEVKIPVNHAEKGYKCKFRSTSPDQPSIPRFRVTCRSP